MESLLNHIKSKISVTAELEGAITELFQLEEIKKKSILLREHQYCKKMYFLAEGTTRTYYFHDDNDTTSWFYKEGDFFTSWHSFFGQQASFEYIEALENCKVYSIDYTNYQQLLSSFREFEKFARLLAEEQSVFLDQFLKGYAFLSAKERYTLLLDYIPDIELRVKLGQIASFLGISQETLSRIRAGK